MYVAIPIHTSGIAFLIAKTEKKMKNVDYRHLTNGSSGLAGQARSQLNRISDRIAQEETELELDHFNEDDAWMLGTILVEEAR